MRIMYTPRTDHERFFIATGGIYTGTPLEIVQAMQRQSAFQQADLPCYLQHAVLRVAQAYGITVSLAGEAPEEIATAFMQGLLHHGLAVRLPDESIDEGRPICVPPAVFAGLEAVRRSGLTNMLDRPRVIALAATLGYADAAAWVQEHRNKYARLIFNGVIVDTEER